MEKALAEIEEWLASNAKPLLGLLGKPASEVEISAFEARTSLVLPPDLSRFYSLHDGEVDESDGIFGCWKWLPLSVVAEEIDLIGSTGILPVFRSGGGDLYVMKSGYPTETDRQVYEWWHENPEEAKVISESLEAFLTQFLEDLRSDRYVYLPQELQALIDRDEF